MWTNTCCSHPLYNEKEREGILGVKRYQKGVLVLECLELLYES